MNLCVQRSGWGMLSVSSATFTCDTLQISFGDVSWLTSNALLAGDKKNKVHLLFLGVVRGFFLVVLAAAATAARRKDTHRCRGLSLLPIARTSCRAATATTAAAATTAPPATTAPGG